MKITIFLTAIRGVILSLQPVDLHFLQMARVQGEKSSFSKAKHGAVIARGNRVVAVGVNSHLSDGTGQQSDQERYVATLNAEIVAVSSAVRAQEALSDVTLYSTQAPNWNTFKTIAAMGLKRILHYSPEAPDRTQHYAKELGIELISVG